MGLNLLQKSKIFGLSVADKYASGEFKILGLGVIFCHALQAFTPIYLHLIFDILKFEISSLNWIYAGYTGSKNPA